MLNNLNKLVTNTPIYKFRNIKELNAFIKLEYANTARSIKSRVAYQMVYDLSKKISLKGKTTLEASGGNTAIGLAMFSKIYGYKLKCVILDNYPKQKIEQLKLFDIDVILSDHTIGLDSHVLKAKEISLLNPNYIYINQLSNQSNIKAHYFGTAGEIVNSFESVDYFLTGIGSGGTITGVGKRLKEEFKTNIIGVLPEGYDINSKNNINHNISGIGIGIKSDILDISVIDEYIYIGENDIKEAFILAKNEGLYVEISALANIAALQKLKNRNFINKDKIAVTIAQDSANSYLDYLGDLQ